MDKYGDLILAALYTLGAAVGLGLADVTLLGYVLSDTWTTISGYDVTFYNILSVAGLAGAWALNTPSWSRLDTTRKGLIGLAGGLIVVSVLSPSTLADLTDETVIAFIVLGLQTGGYWAIAHS